MPARGPAERFAFGLRGLLQTQPGALDGLQHAGFVEGLEQIVDGVDVEGAHRVLVEGRSEDDLRQPVVVLDELLEHGEAVEAGHLHVEKDDVGLVLADELDGLDAVCALGHDFDLPVVSSRYFSSSRASCSSSMMSAVMGGAEVCMSEANVRV